MDAHEVTTANPAILKSAEGGKKVAQKSYLHKNALQDVATSLRSRILDVIANSPGLANSYNVIKIDEGRGIASLLHYPSLETADFPELAQSWIILSDGSVKYRDYRQSLNPPILHRRELLLPTQHPAIPDAVRLTAALKMIGAFDDTARIGYRTQWNSLLRSLGFSVEDSQLAPIGNATSSDMDEEFGYAEDDPILRHRTALMRSAISAPVQLLLRHGLLNTEATFFDYGCGRGDDLRAVQDAGIQSSGWDPYFAKDVQQHPADVVNLGFVLNVIEDVTERREALRCAYALANRVLSIAVMPFNNRSEQGIPHGDGILTSRQTFQRYFTQSDLFDFVESVLAKAPVLIAPGIAFAFKTNDFEEQFLLNRVSGRRRLAIFSRQPRIPRAALRARTEEKERARFEWINQTQNRLDTLWKASLRAGRFPERSEISELGLSNIAASNYRKALKEATQVFPIEELEKAAQCRRDDLLVFLAIAKLRGSGGRRSLGNKTLTDFRHFFGSSQNANLEAEKLLSALANREQLDFAARSAAEIGLGYYRESDFIQLESRLLQRLPVILRIMVAAALALHGDIDGFDLVKIHLRSNKVTLLRYDDFQGSALPKMVERIKINLRSRESNQFLYGEEFTPPYLFHKSRFMNEESPHYVEQVEFDKSLESILGIDDKHYGPSPSEFDALLRRHRHEISGFLLVPASGLPDLDEKCGRYFTYRQLIECGETQLRFGTDNMPKQSDTFNALHQLAARILDPIVEEFGKTELSFGFCSPRLARQIRRRIDPTRDQHASCELSARGNMICTRRGASVDFLLLDLDMREVADWIIERLPFDRLYFYGSARPLHVSVGPQESREAWEMVPMKNGHLRPTKYQPK